MRRRPRALTARRRALVALLLIGLSSVALLATTARPAAAHATLLATTPSGDEITPSVPAEVELRFDEPVEVVDGAVRVFGPDGDRVDQGRVEVDGTALRAPIDGSARGTYTVAWRVLSEDSHNLSGSFVFHVGVVTGAAEIDAEGDAGATAAGAVGRFLALGSALLLFGAGLVVALSGAEPLVVGRLRPLTVGAAAAGVLGVGLVLVARAAQSSGRPLLQALGLVPDLARDTRTGQLTAARGLVLAVGGAIALRGLGRRRAELTAIAGVGAMVLTALAGHAWTADDRALAIGVDVSHQVAAAAWVGGAAALLLALRVTAQRGRLARRFSTAALGGAIAVAVTGTVSAVIEIGLSWEALSTTAYGQLVAVKVACFLVLVTFGWLNRRHLVPLAERSAAPLLRSMRLEVLVAVGVLAVTAMLVEQPPGRTSVAQPFRGSEVVDDARVDLTVSPARTGANDLHLYFFDSTGASLAVDAVEVKASTGDLPPRTLDVLPVTTSHVSVLGASLTTPGDWIVEVTLVRAGAPTTTTFEVPIR